MTALRVVDHEPAYRHEAMLYDGRDGFLEGTVPFIREAVRADEPVLVVVDQEKIDLLRGELGDDAGWVEFADMRAAGSNPARLIAVWRSFVQSHSDSPAVRGIGEPVHPDRDPDELDECRRHEALLNLAFGDDREFWLLCPYDTRALPDDALATAHLTHPTLAESGATRTSDDYEAPASAFEGSLPAPPADCATLEFRGEHVSEVRAFVAREARALGVPVGRIGDLTFAAGELAANSVRHGGGSGTARLWCENGSALVEVSDAGVIGDPLTGRITPTARQVSGRGVWLVNQLCELVQIRSGATGTVVRARVDTTA